MRIKQTIPASGWFAVELVDCDPADEDGELFILDPLVAWATCEHEEEDIIYGMISFDCYVDSAEESDSFYGYIHKDEITEELKRFWNREALKRKAKAKEKP